MGGVLERLDERDVKQGNDKKKSRWFNKKPTTHRGQIRIQEAFKGGTLEDAEKGKTRSKGKVSNNLGALRGREFKH